MDQLDQPIVVVREPDLGRAVASNSQRRPSNHASTRPDPARSTSASIPTARPKPVPVRGKATRCPSGPSNSAVQVPSTRRVDAHDDQPGPNAPTRSEREL